MNRSIQIEEILARINKLDQDSKQNLMDRLVGQLMKKKVNPPLTRHQLTELDKLGNEIWKNVDIEQYIRKEREWR